MSTWTPKSKRLRGLRRADWPEIDHRLWHEAFAPADRLMSLGDAVAWAEPTRVQVAKTWGLYLGYLARIDALDPQQPPSSRVTPDLFRGFIANRKAAGNADNTIAERCFEIRMALQAMEPGTKATHKWVVKPGGRSVTTWFPGRPEPKPIIDAVVLSAWAIDLIESAASVNSSLEDAETLRDGLILAILAERAPRRHSVAAMELGVNVHLRSNSIHLAFRPRDMKERNQLSYNVPPHLMEAFERYLRVCRPRLLAGVDHAMLWVERGEAPMTEPRLSQMVTRRSQARFGIPFGPHRARHALATAAINLMPKNTGIASAILGNSPRVVERHYARANQAMAGPRHIDAIRAAREATRDLAEEAFARR